MIKKLGLISAGTLLLTTQAFALGATQVPEPGPMGLLLVGAASIFVARRFHKNK
jgi:4-amino-4-deoxy-L-arabinose transferase-like glycosyltransferase